MVAYVFAVGVYSFRVRSGGVRDGSIPIAYFKILDAQAHKTPEYVVRVGRHYDNQFELPLLFLITCLACQFAGVVHPAALVAAWAFPLSRAVHTYFHLGSNHILRRARAFFVGWFLVLVMWAFVLLT